MRPTSFDREKTIAKITEAFWEHGYEATSIGVLEEATGLKRQSLYNAFGNKDAMFELALAHYGAAVGERLAAALDNPEPQAGLQRLFAEQLAILQDPARPSGCLVAGAQQELSNRAGALGERMGEGIAAQHDIFAAAFARWKEAGRLVSAADPGDLAALTVSVMRGQAVMARSPTGREVATRAARLAPRLFEPWFA